MIDLKIKCDIVESSEATGEQESLPYYCYTHEDLTDSATSCNIIKEIK